MKRNIFQYTATALACLGTMLPPVALAEQPPATRSYDVALRTGGLLVGQVVDQQGVAKSGKTVSVRYAQQEVVRTTTDANGVFAAQGLRGGQYEIVTDDGGTDCRLWAANTAPPNAQSSALVVSGREIVRGQFDAAHTCVDWVRCHPYLTAAAVATAIAVPLVLSGDDHGPSS